MALVNSTGLQSNENKTHTSQHSSHLHYGSDESFGDWKKTGLREEEEEEEGEELPSAACSRSAGSDTRAPLEQCLEAWCLISDEMSIIRDSAGESGAEQI